MSLRKIGFFILSFVLVFSSCNNDDDTVEEIVVELEDRTDQQVIDDALLVEYLETHYYNESDFTGNADPSMSDIDIVTVEAGGDVPDGYVKLLDAVGTPKTTVFAETDYKYYVLTLNQGGGSAKPHFSDNVFVNYEGFTLDNEVFDSAVSPVYFDLTSLIPAWKKVLTSFNTAENVEEPLNVDTDGDGTPDANDGTIDYVNHGLGVMFVPSGLAYFSGTGSGSISSYSPLVFKFELLQTSENDHDGDGVPSYLEDLFKEDGTPGSDGEFTVNYDDLTDETDDDTDGDGTPDYADADDDGDGVATIDEDINGDGDPTNDIGANGIPNYLDPEETATKE